MNGSALKVEVSCVREMESGRAEPSRGSASMSTTVPQAGSLGDCLWGTLCVCSLWGVEGFLWEITWEWHCHALQRILWDVISEVSRQKYINWRGKLFKGPSTVAEHCLTTASRLAHCAAGSLSGWRKRPLCCVRRLSGKMLTALCVWGWQTAWCFRLWFLPLRGPGSFSIYIIPAGLLRAGKAGRAFFALRLCGHGLAAPA